MLRTRKRGLVFFFFDIWFLISAALFSVSLLDLLEHHNFGLYFASKEPFLCKTQAILPQLDLYPQSVKKALYQVYNQTYQDLGTIKYELF